MAWEHGLGIQILEEFACVQNAFYNPEVDRFRGFAGIIDPVRDGRTIENLREWDRDHPERVRARRRRAYRNASPATKAAEALRKTNYRLKNRDKINAKKRAVRAAKKAALQ